MLSLPEINESYSFGVHIIFNLIGDELGIQLISACVAQLASRWLCQGCRGYGYPWIYPRVNIRVQVIPWIYTLQLKLYFMMTKNYVLYLVHVCAFDKNVFGTLIIDKRFILFLHFSTSRKQNPTVLYGYSVDTYIQNRHLWIWIWM